VEVREAAVPLAAARVELMRELQAAANPQAGGSEALQQTLRNAALERAELEVRISFNESRIGEANAKLRDAMANRPDRRELLRASAAQREVEAASERVAELRGLLESLRVGPIVELVGEAESREERK
jgi:hypothetical protein